MNKIFNIVKIVLYIILLLLNIIYVSIFDFSDIFVIYLLLFIIFGIYVISDLLKNNNINYDNVYNLICIFVQVIIIFIIGRAIFDHNFMYNSPYYRNILELYNQNIPTSSIDVRVIGSIDIKIFNRSYIIQNSFYFIIMIILLLIYRKLNAIKKTSKYSFISLVCLFISILTVIPTLSYIKGGDIKFYLIFNIILVAVEIYRLVRDNHKKREWPIYLSFIFNAFAFIVILAHLLA